MGNAVFGKDLETVGGYRAEVCYFNFGLVEGFLKNQIKINYMVWKTKEKTIKRETDEKYTETKYVVKQLKEFPTKTYKHRNKIRM